MLNADDPLARSTAEAAPGAVITVGFAEDATVRVLEREPVGLEGTRLRVRVEARIVELTSKLLGRHQVYPILTALAGAHIEGVDLDQAGERLEALEAAPGRMALLRLPSGACVINDTVKGSFESYLEALAAMAELPAPRRVVIMGDINEPPGKQSEIYGALAAQLAEVPSALVVHLGRDGKKLRAGARKAGMDTDSFQCLGARVLPAIERIQELVRPDDLILVKGRNTQKLDRIVAALRGETVRCGLTYCNRPTSECLRCPMVAIQQAT